MSAKKENKIAIFIDTNIFISSSYFLDTGEFRILQKYLATYEESELFITQVIIDELEKNFAEQHLSNQNIISLVGELNPNIKTKKGIQKWYRSNIESKFKLFNAIILNIEGIQHSVILERYKNMIPPFAKKKKGDIGGYKDTLNWLVLLNAIKDMKNDYNVKFIIITSDTDFIIKGDKETIKIHETLASELETLSIDYEVFESVTGFIEKYVKPLKDVLDEHLLLTTFSSYAHKILEKLNEGYMGRQSIPILEYFKVLPHIVEGFFVDNIDFTKVQSTNLYETSDDDTIATLEVEFELSGTGLIYKPNYSDYLPEKYDMILIDSDYNESMMQVEMFLKLVGEILIPYNKKSLEFDFDNIEFDYIEHLDKETE